MKVTPQFTIIMMLALFGAFLFNGSQFLNTGDQQDGFFAILFLVIGIGFAIATLSMRNKQKRQD